MRSAARGNCNARRAKPMLGPFGVEQDLPFEHDYGLVQVRVGVKRGRLAPRHPILQQDERPVGLLSGSLHDVHASAGKPTALALSLSANDRACSAHSLLLLPRAFGTLSLNGTYITITDIEVQ